MTHSSSIIANEAVVGALPPEKGERNITSLPSMYTRFLSVSRANIRSACSVHYTEFPAVFLHSFSSFFVRYFEVGHFSFSFFNR